MKKNDIAILLLIISVSALIAFLIGRAIVGEPRNQVAKVESAERISSDIVEPDTKVFNKNAINPTVPIKIGAPSNKQPFNGN